MLDTDIAYGGNGRNIQLPEALQSAELLVNYASRNTIDVPKEILLLVANLRRNFRSDNFSAEEEASFFKAYHDLTKLIPVNVGSLRDTYSELGTPARKWFLFGPTIRRSASDSTVTYFRLITFAVLIVLIGLQGYTFVGGWLVNAIESPTTITVPVKSDSQATPNPIPAIEEQEEDDAAFSILLIWLGPLSLWINRNAESIEDPQVHAKSLVLCAKLILSILQSYLLPLLYGGLGALTYVLRELIEVTRNRTFRKESRTAYGLRVVLGIVAGLAIGWFAGGFNLSSFNITPVALSFFAGYSVEVLFSLMDTVNSAFGSLSRERKA